MDNKQIISTEDKLAERARALELKLNQTKNRWQQIKAKYSAEAKKRRDRALYNLAGIFAMVNQDRFLTTAENPTIYRLILGAALLLDELLSATDENSKIELAKLEHKAKSFLNNKSNNLIQE